MEWKNLFREEIIERGRLYFKQGVVQKMNSSDGEITAEVAGSDIYNVSIKYDNDKITSMKCNCPYAQSGENCKHMAAVMFSYDAVLANENEACDEACESNDDIIKLCREKLELSCEIDDVINYAVYQHDTKIIRDICIRNTSEQDINNLFLTIESDNALVDKFSLGIDKLETSVDIHFKDIRLHINSDYLASLTERVTCNLKVRVFYGDTEVISETKEVVALAFDEWPGLKYTPELLASFSLPNHPVVTSLIQLASKFLEKWTKDPSLSGYQSGDPNRVKQMAAAAYAAIQQKNITYANPPSSFEILGQRIRLADAVMDQHLGTCIDMTLLYVACLEAMGLNPVMVMMRGHIFAGVWLVEESFPDTIMDDPSHLEKRMANGIHEMVVVECTCMCAGKTQDFDNAVKIAESNVSNYGSFEFVIDVIRARSMGIRPLPIRVLTDAGFVVSHKDRSDSEVTNAPTEVGKTFDLSGFSEKEEVTKLTQWERKLLDLSMRNMLINMRFTKAVVPLLCSNVGMLEDALNDGEEFQVLPRPDNMNIKGDGVPVEALTDMGPFKDFIELESRHKRLHSFYTEKELTSCLTKIYRSAKTSLEENGASTLYLALGLLRWVEGKKIAQTVRYAPVIMIPIDITRNSASKGYTMRMRDEDAQINITLLEFLKQNYDIQIMGLKPLPIDEHGLDIDKIFAIIRKSVMNLAMWDVLEVGFIGNFSFSQFVMWNDIHNRSDILERNNIVRSLMKGAVDWDCSIPEAVDTDEAYLPITADNSQLRAINMAANDVSFVLHGPPGTGKSQTITAMIANALTKGKTVLFVAEKMAALEVVEKRLNALGIGDFCLELHSNKATKKSVLDQLKRTLEIGERGLKTEYDSKIEDIRRMKKDIDAYVEKLYEYRPFGKSVKELIDIYETITDYGIELRFDTAYAGKLTQRDLDTQRRFLEQLVAAGREIGHPNGHPLSAVGQTVYTQTLKRDLEECVMAYKKALEELKETTAVFAAQMNIEMPVSLQEWNKVYLYVESVISAESIPSILLNAANIDAEFDYPLTYEAERDALLKRKDDLLKNWQETFIYMDMSIYRKKYDDANNKFLGIGKGKAISNLISEMQSFSKETVTVEQIPAILAGVELFQKQEKQLEEKKAGLSFEWKQILEGCKDAQALQAYKTDVKKKLIVIGQFSEQIRNLKQSSGLDACIDNARKMKESYNILAEDEKKVIELLKISFKDNGGDWIADREAVCDNLISNAPVIKDWIVYKQYDDMCREAGLGVVCDAYENGLPHEQVMSVYLRSIYKAIILSVIETESVLNSFTGNGFNEKIVQFKKLDEEFMELTKDEMYYKLTHNLPSGYDNVEISKELNILRRAISSNGRGISIRSLFDQIPDILVKLCPCMLMSPISVAQYLSADNAMYDIVIFDEASQLPTCKAVGVLARGKNAVIVGDPNQMPPTSFFAGNTVDEDNLDIEDLDSILDDCLALGMPSAHLQWHYRSRHESLIAFSNNEFYENAMLTFPSVNDREKRVSMVKVNGFFDRKKGRINEAEADAIIEEIKRRYKDINHKNESIGVVTFNITQQALIEDKLQETFQKDEEFDKWASSGDEALFVKNLENVQGDERDVILFSVAFGPDEEGKLSLNFGPLNKEGGWKRLNVAVSRARSEMIVFSTMTSDMIDLKRTKAKGVEALKNFLLYAQKGNLQMAYNDVSTRKSQGILESVCKALTDAGYVCQTSVGHSKFKVDIAVVNPYKEDEYLLGIMFDGDSYRQSSNTKDREVAQIMVLEGLGWTLHRIWTMDWWDNKEKELKKLLDLLEEQKLKYNYANDDAKEDGGVAETQCESAKEAVIDIKDEERSQENIDKPVEEEITETESENADDYTNDKPVIIQEISMPVTLKSDDDLPKAAKLADAVNQNEDERIYSCDSYISASVPVIKMSSADYVLKTSAGIIAEHAQQIIDAEAPISYDRLVKKILRSFDISRSSVQTLEATDKALKKINAKSARINGVKFFWKENQSPESYYVYRKDTEIEDKRSLEDICPQEVKNAVCITLNRIESAKKDELIRETIRTMGYSRSGVALVDVVERGIKYAKKTGEIVLKEDNMFTLNK